MPGSCPSVCAERIFPAGGVNPVWPPWLSSSVRSMYQCTLYCETPKSCSRIAALPERRGLLIFADADAFAEDVLRFRNTGVGVVGKLGVEQPPAGKHRQRDDVEAALARDQIRRHRHLADFEFLKFELAPESFRRMGVSRARFRCPPLRRRLSSAGRLFR